MKSLLSQEIRSPKVLLLAVLLLFLPFGLYPSFEAFGATVRLSQLVGLALIGALLPDVWRKRRDWLRLPWVFLLLFTAMSALSSFWATSRAEGFITTSFYAFVFVLAYVVSKVFKLNHSGLYKNIIYGSGLFVVAFCVFQFIGDSVGVGREFTLLLTPYTKAVFGFSRIQGFSLEPLYLANFLLIPFSLALVEYVYTDNKVKLLLASVFLTTVLMTVARGAYLSVAAIILISLAALVYKGQYRRFWSVFAITIAGVAVSAGIIITSGAITRTQITKTIVPVNSRPNLPTQEVSPEGNASRLANHVESFSSDMSFQDRVKTLRKALQLGMERPVLGVGPGNFGPYVVANAPDEYTDPAQVVNNEPAELFAETGVAGLLLMLGFATFLARSVVKRKYKSYGQDSNIWFYGTALMLLGFAVQWQTFSTLYITHIWVMIGIFLAPELRTQLRGGKTNRPA